MIKEPFLIHNHTEFSNLRLKDSTNKIEDVLNYAIELGLPGIAITDHASIGGHVRIERYMKI